MQTTMIGHSTVLIETQGKRILTDPYFGTFGNLAYKRLSLPAMRREDLMDVDLVLQSHSHFDHLDRRFLRLLPRTVPTLAPKRMFLRVSGTGDSLQRVETWSPYPFGEITITPV